MPDTTRVVQMLPGPMPTLMQLAPASIKARVASCVATLPAMMGSVGKAARSSRIMDKAPLLWACAVSMEMRSTFAWISASTRSSESAVTPTAAPHSSRPCESLAELGYLVVFSISLMVIRPQSSY